ncbi:WD40 repeat-like protein [Fusarium austroafricanum]|uniref:WD40 repeat-like protein n=1 Tax=Fusarium austroafricanum TaxID=2364996 RepID=A0A8H4K4E4_9HYPO|nr:WD40 repeat-like protein [Fusarium austroafricanum]
MDQVKESVHHGKQDPLEETEQPATFEAREKKLQGGCQLQIFIDLMSSSLRADMCCLIQPGTLFEDIAQSRIDDAIPTDLAYMCACWVDHLQALHEVSQAEILRENGPVHIFLEQSGLFWLEAMSLLGKTTEALVKLGILGSMINAAEHPKLARITRDMELLVFNHLTAIEQAPLQIYVCTLLFSPKDSPMSDQCKISFSSGSQKIDFSWITPMDNEWSPILFTIQVSNATIDRLLFSPTGDLLVYSSSDKTISLWDSVRGTKRLEYEVPWLSGSLAFSPSGRSIISATDFHSPQESPIRILDLVTGNVEQFGDRQESMFRAAPSLFSDDYITVSRKGIIQGWNVNEEDEGYGELRISISDFLERSLQPLWISEAVFSLNLAFLLIIEDGKFVIQWDLRHSKVSTTFELPDQESVKSVSISSDGKTVALVLERDSTQDGCQRRRDIPTYILRVYNVETGLQQAEAQYGFQPISSIAFLPYGSEITVALPDQGIELLDTKGCAVLGRYSIPDGASQIAVSRDGRKLAVDGPPGYIYMLDIAAIRGSTSPDVSDSYDFAQFLPYDDDMVLISSPSETKLWDTSDGTKETIDMTDVTMARTFPDANLVALTSRCNRTQIWNLQLQKQLFADFGRIEHASFTKDNNRLALAIGGSRTLGNNGQGIRIIDTVTLEIVASFDVGRVLALGISPNGQVVAWQTDLDNENNTAQLWSIETRKKKILRVSSGSCPCSITFSPDSNWVAFSGQFKTVYRQRPKVVLGEIPTAKKSFLFSDNSIQAFAFHPRNHLNATGDDSGQIVLRETKSLSEKLRLKVAKCAGDEGRTFAYIQMWDITTGQELGRYRIDLDILGLQDGFLSAPGREHVSFPEDELLLHLSNGQLPLPSTRPNNGERAEKEHDAAKRCLWVSENWIMRGFERLMMLPRAYQTGVVAVKDDKIVIGRRDGPPVLIKLDLERTPVSVNLGERTSLSNQGS